jgi:DNA-binding FadR family transcriptional regulator
MQLHPFTPPDATPGPSIAEISRRILGFIAHARVVPGDRLPAERSLQNTLNVSRSRCGS